MPSMGSHWQELTVTMLCNKDGDSSPEHTQAYLKSMFEIFEIKKKRCMSFYMFVLFTAHKFITA